MTAWVRRRSFQGRLTTLVAVAVGIAVALVACASYFTVSRQLNKQVDQRLEGYHTQIQQSAGHDSPYGGSSLSPAVLHADEQNGNIVEIVPQGGSPISLSTLYGQGTSMTFTPTKGETALAGMADTNYRIDSVSHNGISYRVLSFPAVYNSATASVPASFLIATPLTQTQTTLAHLRLLLYVLLLTGIAVAIALGLLIARVTIRPVERLTAAAEHVAATQQLDAVIDDDGTDELGRLAHAFNEMLGALGASRQQQAQLVSDAGHELRTPLTSLRTNVELMMRAKQLPEADQRELYGDISAQIEELTTLIGDLVELARQDEQQPEPVEVRLDSIVAHAVQRAQRRAPGLTFDVVLAAGSVRAQPPLLERAVLNVLDNAAKWSPPGGTVEVRLRRGEVWVLEICDHGPGIAAEDRPKVFDRFYRAPTARAMPGSGLGLAIVAQVVQSHGGRVLLDDTPGGGTRMRIELPTVVEQEPSPGPLPADGAFAGELPADGAFVGELPADGADRPGPLVPAPPAVWAPPVPTDERSVWAPPPPDADQGAVSRR